MEVQVEKGEEKEDEVKAAAPHEAQVLIVVVSRRACECYTHSLTFSTDVKFSRGTCGLPNAAMWPHVYEKQTRKCFGRSAESSRVQQVFAFPQKLNCLDTLAACLIVLM